MLSPPSWSTSPVAPLPNTSTRTGLHSAWGGLCHTLSHRLGGMRRPLHRAAWAQNQFSLHTLWQIPHKPSRTVRHLLGLGFPICNMGAVVRVRLRSQLNMG